MTYQIKISDSKYTQNVKNELTKEGFQLEKGTWTLLVN